MSVHLWLLWDDQNEILLKSCRLEKVDKYILEYSVTLQGQAKISSSVSARGCITPVIGTNMSVQVTGDISN